MTKKKKKIPWKVCRNFFNQSLKFVFKVDSENAYLAKRISQVLAQEEPKPEPPKNEKLPLLKNPDEEKKSEERKRIEEQKVLVCI